MKYYKYIEHTQSLCPICKKKIDGKIIEKEGSVFVWKYCPEHGEFCHILEENAAYFHQRRLFEKPGNTFANQTQRGRGCPFDCGLCPEHEQHTCIGLIEVTSKCNLRCPVCFADSGKDDFLPLDRFEQMVDFFVESEGGKCDILQISGGEPALHPDILPMIELARSKNIDYVMLNTNGLRIAEDRDFVEQLSRYKGGFEVYLQLDGLDDKIHTYFRGKPLAEIKQKALDNLNACHIPVTLVTTLERGVNEHAVGRIIELGLTTRCIRGINIQPVAYFGRLPEVMPENRLTITSVIKEIAGQCSPIIRESDFIPLPCNPDRVAITYFYRKKDNTFVPLTRDMNVQKYLPFIKNTFKFDPDDFLKEMATHLSSKNCCNAMGFFKDLTKYIPISYAFKSEEEKINYVTDNTFRISITSFVDAYNFDIKSAQKECVHVITPDLKKIPFSMYNLLHRK
ncbi:MAG: radical SAM protein [Prevotellaceae bacterium]|nr:radical SAM protein [Prevotellaceae bacterium]